VYFVVHNPTRNKKPNKKGNDMKLEIDWIEMLKAAAKAIWPFVAGAVGGLSPAAPSQASDPTSCSTQVRFQLHTCVTRKTHLCDWKDTPV
jgi:hypothetical protein